MPGLGLAGGRVPPSPKASTYSGSAKEQVLVANLHGTDPDVHLVRLEPSKGLLCLYEASVDKKGGVELGRERTLSLAQAARVVSVDGVIGVLGGNGEILAHLHMENASDERSWMEALQLMVNNVANGVVPPVPSAGQGDDGVHSLQEQSRQLQTEIGKLEAISERRDKQLNNMMRRLDGAMQMLSAVQDMCQQQGNVIKAQEVAIIELRQDCGEDGPDAADLGNSDISGVAGGGQGAQQHQQSSSGGELAETEAEIAAKADQMLVLLQQADQMQRVLKQLESGELDSLPDSALDDLEGLTGLSQLLGGTSPGQLGGLLGHTGVSQHVGTSPAARSGNASLAPSAKSSAAKVIKSSEASVHESHQPGQQAWKDAAATSRSAGLAAEDDYLPSEVRSGVHKSLERELAELQAENVKLRQQATPSGTGSRVVSPSAKFTVSPSAKSVAAKVVIEDADDDEDEANSEEVAAALGRLRHLEAEKDRFEAMLRDSQVEHDDMLGRLNDMRKLMTSLGMEEDVADIDAEVVEADLNNLLL